MAREENSNIDVLRQQLSVARSEISNLRQQLKALGCNQQKETEKIHRMLSTYQCSTCQQNPSSNQQENTVSMRPIGLVSTWFPEKKGTPRQPGVCINGRGQLTLFNTVFTNPEHALEGLEDFSHMWILFYFHKNDSLNVKAKVSPPRLNGIRTGVFGTRSPHRPSPIGLSLVAIDKIEGSTIFFSGVDMVDGTPVLDIKPYIPQYDSPLHCTSVSSVASAMSALRLTEGREAPELLAGPTRSAGCSTAMAGGEASSSTCPVTPTDAEARLERHDARMGEREAPDGEEGSQPFSTSGGGSSPLQQAREEPAAVSQVRVPAWITQPATSKLSVTFSDRAKAQLENITSGSESAGSIRNAIKSVLREDPRSVYLRERWSNQFYTFLICNLHVSCKFDDVNHVVSVFQVRSAAKLCECGQLEWQCSIHNEDCE